MNTEVQNLALDLRPHRQAGLVITSPRPGPAVAAETTVRQQFPALVQRLLRDIEPPGRRRLHAAAGTSWLLVSQDRIEEGGSRHPPAGLRDAEWFVRSKNGRWSVD